MLGQGIFFEKMSSSKIWLKFELEFSFCLSFSKWETTSLTYYLQAFFFSIFVLEPNKTFGPFCIVLLSCLMSMETSASNTSVIFFRT